VPQEYYY